MSASDFTTLTLCGARMFSVFIAALFYDFISLLYERAKLRFHVHPHMLRHSCGYYLANKGYDTRLVQDYLGHRNIAHTVKYTRTAVARPENFGAIFVREFFNPVALVAGKNADHLVAGLKQ